MRQLPRDPVTEALRHPHQLVAQTLPQWDVLVRLARRSNLLARLAVMLDDTGALAQVPAGPRGHLNAVQVIAEAQERALRHEVALLRDALLPVIGDVVLLKGTAYVLAGLPPARGRLFSDIDILVPEASLARVEAALMRHGWATTHHDPYDQRYYRRWMHELPPMRHMRRLTVLDVHHTILPRTARLRPDARKLLDAAVAIEDEANVRVLAPADMVLHSATHLFTNEEFSNGLRDLADLDLLLRHFGALPGFWEGLVPRAVELQLARPLHYGLRYATALLGTPVPDGVMQAAQVGKPGTWRTSLMDTLFTRVLRPDHPLTSDALTPLAREALYVRAHWLRMPPHLLAYHLTRKALRREEAAPQQAA
jgi:hypothetical protein